MKIRVFSNTLTKLTVTKSLNKVTTQKASYVFTPLIYIPSHEVDAITMPEKKSKVDISKVTCPRLSKW